MFACKNLWVKYKKLNLIAKRKILITERRKVTPLTHS